MRVGWIGRFGAAIEWREHAEGPLHHRHVLPADFLDVAEREQRAHGLLHCRAHLLLLLSERCHGMFKILGHESLHRPAIQSDQLAQEVGGQQVLALALFFHNDLGQHAAGDVVAAFGVVDNEISSQPHHFGKVVQRDVAGTLGVVEPPVGILLNHDRRLFASFRVRQGFNGHSHAYLAFTQTDYRVYRTCDSLIRHRFFFQFLVHGFAAGTPRLWSGWRGGHMRHDGGRRRGRCSGQPRQSGNRWRASDGRTPGSGGPGRSRRCEAERSRRIGTPGPSEAGAGLDHAVAKRAGRHGGRSGTAGVLAGTGEFMVGNHVRGRSRDALCERRQLALGRRGT